MSTEFSKLLGQLGIQKSLHRIRFGGIVGKQALVAVSCIAALGLAIWKTDTALLQGACIGLIFLAGIGGLFAIGFHGHRHSIEATLEGAEIVAWQHQVLGAKGIPAAPQDQPPIVGVPSTDKTPPGSPEGSA